MGYFYDNRYIETFKDRIILCFQIIVSIIFLVVGFVMCIIFPVWFLVWLFTGFIYYDWYIETTGRLLSKVGM